MSQVGVEGLDPQLLSNKVVDRVLGCIYGNALGDAVGLATEFLDKEQVQSLYGDGRPINFPNFKRNSHNVRWPVGDWTDDTDQMILIMETLTEQHQAHPQIYAKKLSDWIDHGFPEVGDTVGMGLGATTSKVVQNKNFLKDPIGTAYKIWNDGGRQLAPNGGIMRTSVVGCFHFNSIDDVISTSDTFCKVTHSDPRCVASCRAVVITIALLLEEGQRQLHLHPPTDGAQLYDTIIARIRENVRRISIPQDQLKEFEEYLVADSLDKMNLSESSSIGYTLKAMGAGMWGLRSKLSFQETIEQLAMEGGDADSNGAVCGAVLGCKLGYSALPSNWLAALPNKKWLDAKVVQFIKECVRVD